MGAQHEGYNILRATVRLLDELKRLNAPEPTAISLQGENAGYDDDGELTPLSGSNVDHQATMLCKWVAEPNAPMFVFARVGAHDFVQWTVYGWHGWSEAQTSWSGLLGRPEWELPPKLLEALHEAVKPSR